MPTPPVSYQNPPQVGHYYLWYRTEPIVQFAVVPVRQLPYIKVTGERFPVFCNLKVLVGRGEKKYFFGAPQNL